MSVLTLNHVELPRFAAAPITRMGKQQIINIASPILSKRLSMTKYDRVVIAVQYLNHLFALRSFDPKITAIEAFSSFRIDSSLAKNNGNSCVGLSLDLMGLLPKEIAAYPAGATLSNRYQQKCGPLYSHVTPLIAYENPKDSKDQGYIILDPSFHIGKPIVLPLRGPSDFYDMGGKKGVWTFSIENDRILCQAGPRPGETEWEKSRMADSLMIYRMDRMENPEESSAMPMFAIDRSYPIVSRDRDGSQLAHINVDLNKREVHVKIGEEKKPPVSFSSIQSGFKFDARLADALLLDLDDLNKSVSLIAHHVDSLDELYHQFIDFLRKDDIPNEFEKSDFRLCQSLGDRRS